MLRSTTTVAAILGQFAMIGLAQKALPRELVLTTRCELEQAHLPYDMDLKSGALAEAYDSVALHAHRPAGVVFTCGCETPEQSLVSLPAAYLLARVLDGKLKTANRRIFDPIPEEPRKV